MYEFPVSELPKFGDEKMLKFAARLMNEHKAFKDARSTLETQIWPDCIRAFMCLRDIPKYEWVDDGPLGSTIIWEFVNKMVDSLVLAMMPPDEVWLTPVSNNEEDQAILDKIQAQQSHLHELAGTRQGYSKHLTQLHVLGTSAISVRWDSRYALKRLGTRQSRRVMQSMHKSQTGEDIDLGQIRVPYKIYDAPVVQPINMYDLLLDPTSDLNQDPSNSCIWTVYKTPDDLKFAIDDQGKKVYSNLDGIQPYSPEEIYKRDPWRYLAMRNMGLNPMGQTNSGELVPVHIFHKLLRYDKEADLRLADCFIYVAESKAGEGHQIIRIQENPSDYGDRPFYVDTMHEWLTNAYGIGVVEKALPDYHRLNVLSALRLNAQVAQVFPAMAYIGGIMRDGKKPQLGPQAMNEITWRMGVGLDFIKPMIPPNDGVLMALQAEKWHGSLIEAEMGTTGVGAVNDPTKSVSQDKTATQVRQETVNAMSGRENQVEKFTLSSLRPLAQAFYNLSRQHLSGSISYSKRMPNGDMQGDSIKASQLDKERRIEIIGRRGLANKAHEIANLKDALEILSSGNAAEILPNLAPILQEILMKLLSRLGVMLTPEMKMSPMELATMDPRAQMQMLQAALSSPEGQQVLLELVSQDPQLQQALLQLAQQINQPQGGNGGNPGSDGGAPQEV